MFSRLRARTPPPGSCDFPSSSFSSSFSSTTTTSSPVCMGVVPVWGIWPPSQSQLAVHSSSKLCAVASCAQILPTRRTRARRGTARCIISLTQSRVVSTHTHTHTQRERERERRAHTGQQWTLTPCWSPSRRTRTAEGAFMWRRWKSPLMMSRSRGVCAPALSCVPAHPRGGVGCAVAQARDRCTRTLTAHCCWLVCRHLCGCTPACIYMYMYMPMCTETRTHMHTHMHANTKRRQAHTHVYVHAHGDTRTQTHSRWYMMYL